MADRLYCALNGTTLRDLDARIHLLDVEELAPAVRTVTARRIGGGLHLLRRQREQLSLRVRFLIEEYDIATRHQLLHLVAAWAEAGGVLTLHEDGRIISQRDYYDLWGDIFNGIPWFVRRYRKFMRKKFG